VLIHAGVQLTAEDIRKVAALARLTLTEDEIARMTADIARILDYVAKLDELETKAIEATSHVVTMETPFRPDVVTSAPSVESSLANAPEREDGYFVVPAIIE